MPSNKEYFDDDYFSRKNFSEVLLKGGYTKGDHINDNIWKWKFLKKFIPKKKLGEMKILDVGCGAGHFLNCVPNKMKKFGTDISKASQKIMKKNKIKFVLCDVTSKVPFKDKFDIISAFDVFEHLEKPEKALKNINKMLAKEGILVVEVPMKTVFNQLLGKIKLGTLDIDPTHVKKENFDYWNKLFSKDFEIVIAKKVFIGTLNIPCFNIDGLFVLKKK